MTVLLVTNTIQETLEESQFTHMAVSGGDYNVCSNSVVRCSVGCLLPPPLQRDRPITKVVHNMDDYIGMT